ncbi:MAG: M23 family metallopeptidase [Halioglobus sp.]|nr:M23 family metallopeptidase [Halioglobus sp.]
MRAIAASAKFDVLGCIAVLVPALLLTVPLPTAAAEADCGQWRGEFTQGGLVWGRVPAGSRVTLDGAELDVLDDGTTLAGFGRDAPPATELVVKHDGVCRRTLKIAPRDYRIQRVEGVPQETVTPSAEHLQRIARERRLVAAAKARRIERPDLLRAALAGFEWPAVGPISGVYGSQRYYNGVPRSPHYGVDVAMPSGTPVTAPAPGVVTLAEPDLFYSGGTIILDHGFGLSSSFLHLSELSVEVDQEVGAGELIGRIGASGRATGAHLDWRMSWRSERIDPQLLAPPMPGQ